MLNIFDLISILEVNYKESEIHIKAFGLIDQLISPVQKFLIIIDLIHFMLVRISMTVIVKINVKQNNIGKKVEYPSEGNGPYHQEAEYQSRILDQGPFHYLDPENIIEQ